MQVARDHVTRTDVRKLRSSPRFRSVTLDSGLSEICAVEELQHEQIARTARGLVEGRVIKRMVCCSDQSRAGCAHLACVKW